MIVSFELRQQRKTRACVCFEKFEKSDKIEESIVDCVCDEHNN